jgi:uncharacterized spore protein YtfJ
MGDTLLYLFYFKRKTKKYSELFSIRERCDHMDKFTVQRNGTSPIRAVFDKISPTTKTETVFGEAVEVENKKVIPVSKATYFVGGGGGYGSENESKQGGGEGGTGFIQIKPVGVYEISSKKTRYIPVFDLSRILLLASSVCLLVSYLIWNKKE